MNQVLMAPEAEAYVDSLVPLEIAEVGSSKWMRQHDYIEKLNMQAMCNAFKNEDEFVKEFLISYDKLPMLIGDLIVTDLWKKKVFPKLADSIKESKAAFPFYFILYHELTLMTLLETVLYHPASCQALEDTSLDLVDYCYEKVTHLRNNGHYCNDLSSSGKGTNTITNVPLYEELQEQKNKINFLISLKALSVLRFLIDNMKSICLSVTKRIYSTLDVAVLFVELIENPPWVCEHHGAIKKNDGASWKNDVDLLKLNKIDVQVWLGLFQLLVTDMRNNYDFNSYRKNIILKLRPRLNDVTVDQLPVLVELQRFLDQLSFHEPEPPKNGLILEQLPEIKINCLRRYKGKWAEIAEKQLEDYFMVDSDSVKALAKNLSETYSLDNLENFLPNPPKCVMCGEKAGKKCSRCQNEWYCRRECQVKHWSRHQTSCDMIADSKK